MQITVGLSVSPSGRDMGNIKCCFKPLPVQEAPYKILRFRDSFVNHMEKVLSLTRTQT